MLATEHALLTVEQDAQAAIAKAEKVAEQLRALGINSHQVLSHGYC